MLSNRTKRNIWLVLTIVSALSVPDLAARVARGEVGWWLIAVAIVVTALCNRFHTSYRREVRRGNLFGRVNVF